jgi:uncharacterized protein (DUF2342 family)
MADDDTPSGNFPFGSFGDGNPFGAMPFLGDIMKSLAGQGPLNWDIARQVAYVGLGQGGTNVDPAARIACENLAPLAHRHLADFLAGVETREPRIECVTPAQWCHSTLDAYRPVFDNLAAALAQRPASDVSPDPAADPMSSMMNGLMSAMAPMMLGMTVGSMVGQLAARAFGQYDLLLPPTSTRLPESGTCRLPTSACGFSFTNSRHMRCCPLHTCAPR